MSGIGEPGNGQAGLSASAARLDPSARTVLEVRRRAGLEVIEARLPGPFRMFFTTRLGGASRGSYAALNLHERSGDDPSHVRHNRALVAAAVADEPPPSESPIPGPLQGFVGKPALMRTPEGKLVPAEEASVRKSQGPVSAPGSLRFPEENGPYRLVSPLQAHGVRVAGAAEYLAAQQQGDEAAGPCDGLTLHPGLDRGLVALLLFADCVPVVLMGETDMAVVHAGWRGLLGGVIERAAVAMMSAPGLAIIGPSLGPCCFTVDRGLAESFAGRFGSQVVQDDHVDLWAATTAVLRELGFAPHRVINPRLCTACNPDLFYSHRLQGPETGRQGCVAWTVTP